MISAIFLLGVKRLKANESDLPNASASQTYFCRFFTCWSSHC